ncbi:type I-C CRISPR-associated protein Cas5c [Solibacillus isronensis]|uniref:type I-C CRISPR-associated protein Cas5c n=1 Tax=Solibacillus isronensis TaxID=412383 RepID=UPI0009A59B9D|nr:type I-C CRISPR-associated protein Cas5c [Solibacillus isronensis]
MLNNPKPLPTIDFVVHGKNALFTEPFSKNGGEKTTALIPTYDAMRGIAESIYWKPSIKIVIEKVRVMNNIQTCSKGMLTKNQNGSKGLFNYTYLQDVAYQVKVRLEPNLARPDLKADQIMKKHNEIFKRAVKKGGRFDVFLGTRDCIAYVEPCVFGEGESYYDTSDILDFGLMVHSINYPDSSTDKSFYTRFWNAQMTDGVIHFPSPEECIVKRPLTTKEYSFTPINIKSADEELNGLEGGE